MNFLLRMRFDNNSLEDISPSRSTWDRANPSYLPVQYSDSPFGSKYKSVYIEPRNFTCYDCRSCNHDISIPYEGEFAVSFWEYKLSGSFGYYGFDYVGNSSNFLSFSIATQGEDVFFVFIGGENDRKYVKLNNGLIREQWVHYLISYKNGKIKTFSNGKLIDYKNPIAKDPRYLPIDILKKDSSSLFFIKGYPDQNHYFGGKLFDFCIIDKAIGLNANIKRIAIPTDYVDEQYFSKKYANIPDKYDIKIY